MYCCSFFHHHHAVVAMECCSHPYSIRLYCMYCCLARKEKGGHSTVGIGGFGLRDHLSSVLLPWDEGGECKTQQQTTGIGRTALVIVALQVNLGSVSRKQTCARIGSSRYTYVCVTCCCFYRPIFIVAKTRFSIEIRGLIIILFFCVANLCCT